MAKSIPEVKIGNEVYQIKDRTAREHLVEVSTTQPTSEDNKLWINNQENEYEVPTMDEFNGLKSALSVVQDDLSSNGLLPIRNLVKAMIGGKTTSGVVAGNSVTISDNSGRAYTVIHVIPGYSYSVNTFSSNNFSGFSAVGSDGVERWIGPINNYKITDYVYTAPEGAEKLYLCNTGWDANTGLVVLQTSEAISTSSGYTKENYPFNTIVRFEANKSIYPYTALIGNNVSCGGAFPTFSGNSAANDPLHISVARIYYNNIGQTGMLVLSNDNLTNLSFDIAEGNALVFDYKTATASVVSLSSVASVPLDKKVILLWKQNATVKGEWAWMYYTQIIQSRTEHLPVLEGNEVPLQGEGFATFSGNTSQNDPLVASLPRMYYTSQEASGVLYLSNEDLASKTYTIGHNEGLFFNYKTNTAAVMSITSVTLANKINKVCLLWKQGTTIKGAWAWMYYKTLVEKAAEHPLFDRCVTKRLHSRQGQGYSYPDNSLEGVKVTMKDGYPGIRIAVASTSDNVIYCTHSYEMRNNKTLNLDYVTVKATGDVYDGDVKINECTSEFINTLQYKGYDIPTLASVLAYLNRFEVAVTLEVKDRMSSTAVTNMLTLCHYYGIDPVYSCDAYNTSDVLSVSEDIHLETILEPYSDNLAETRFNALKDHCKSLRFGLIYGDTMPTQNVVASYHALGVTYRTAGSNPTQAQFEDAIAWADVVEVYGNYQTWINRLVNETW